MALATWAVVTKRPLLILLSVVSAIVLLLYFVEQTVFYCATGGPRIPLELAAVSLPIIGVVSFTTLWVLVRLKLRAEGYDIRVSSKSKVITIATIFVVIGIVFPAARHVLGVSCK